jgi:hypothetical protein
MVRYIGPHTAFTIAMQGGLYLVIVPDHYRGPHTALNIALHGGLYLAIIMDRYGMTQISLT